MTDKPHRDGKSLMCVAGDVQHGPSLLTEGDIYLFKEGNHFKLFE